MLPPHSRMRWAALRSSCWCASPATASSATGGPAPASPAPAATACTASASSSPPARTCVLLTSCWSCPAPAATGAWRSAPGTACTRNSSGPATSPGWERNCSPGSRSSRAPIIEVRVERLPDGRSPHRTMWLWHSGPQKPDLDVCWRAYLRRFDMEHTFKLMKSQLGWSAARIRNPEQAVRWTWLLIAAYVQLRLARGLAADLRRPWERRPRPGRPLTPYRVRRSFRHLRDRLGTPARLPKTTHPGPGRPPGGKNTPAPRHRLGSELRKTGTPKKAGGKEKG